MWSLLRDWGRGKLKKIKRMSHNVIVDAKVTIKSCRYVGNSIIS
jgi:hypothetical protein